MNALDACIHGYEDAQLDNLVIGLQTAYYTAYYSHMKHPKPLAELVQEFTDAVNSKQKGLSSHVSDVDVAAFLAREEQFNAKLTTKT